jgi:hypothetical protein
MMSNPFINNKSKVTYNPASRLFQYRDDLVKKAAKESYNAYYIAIRNKKYSPCSAILEPAKESVRTNMLKKGYDEKVIEAYSNDIAKELVKMCEAGNNLGVQRLAGECNDDVNARLAAKGGTRRHRRQKRYVASRRARASTSKSGI